jgi:hypothetical protein
MILRTFLDIFSSSLASVSLSGSNLGASSVILRAIRDETAKSLARVPLLCRTRKEEVQEKVQDANNGGDR